MEVPLLAFIEAFLGSAALMKRAPDEQSKGAYGLLSLIFLGLGLVWIVVGLAAVRLVTDGYKVDGFWPYVGTMALVSAVGLTAYLPRRLRPRRAR